MYAHTAARHVSIINFIATWFKSFFPPSDSAASSTFFILSWLLSHSHGTNKCQNHRKHLENSIKKTFLWRIFRIYPSPMHTHYICRRKITSKFIDIQLSYMAERKKTSSHIRHERDWSRFSSSYFPSISGLICEFSIFLSFKRRDMMMRVSLGV